VDHARQRHTVKRGSAPVQVTLGVAEQGASGRIRSRPRGPSCTRRRARSPHCTRRSKGATR
jgi:hypothetical protein